VTIVEDRPLSGNQAGPAELARRAMIESQLRPTGVNAEFVLRRMAAVERERFVPKEVRGFAYIDRAIDLGDGRQLAAPIVQGLMLQEAKPTPDDNALLVDGGSGYLAELLRPLVGSLAVISPEQAVTKSRKSEEHTLLLIDGAIEQLPEGLVRRMAEGGRVVTGMLDDGLTRLAIGRKAAGQVTLLPLAELGMPALPEFAAPKRWSF